MGDIYNENKTLLISGPEIEKKLASVTRMEMEIPFSTLEDALKIFEAMGCGYDNIKIIAYYTLAKKGIVLISKNIGIELKESEKDPIPMKIYEKDN